MWEESPTLGPSWWWGQGSTEAEMGPIPETEMRAHFAVDIKPIALVVDLGWGRHGPSSSGSGLGASQVHDLKATQYGIGPPRADPEAVPARIRS
jgi:hypothetical protein